MSEVNTKVEEPVIAPTTEATTTETPVVEPVVETVEPTTEAVAEPATEEAAVVEPVKPVEEGTLGYKGPGLLNCALSSLYLRATSLGFVEHKFLSTNKAVFTRQPGHDIGNPRTCYLVAFNFKDRQLITHSFRGLIFQKKFFWFGSEPVETKSLSSYLRGEKEAAAANHNAAWASHTGNGLLFFSKKATDKAAPAGLFNLSDVTDLAEEGTTDFHFTSGGHKHTFQAALLAERDNWVAVLKTKIEEAKALAESVKESEEYKTSLSALTKPVVAAVAAPKKEVKEEKKEEKAEAKEEKKEEKKEVKEEKKEEKTRKSRSASRKRTSIFGGINFGGKKEDKVEEASEETPIVASIEEPAAEATPEVAEPTTEPTEVVATEETAPAAEAVKPVANKRSSIFGQLQSRFSSKGEKKEAEAPAVPAKDAETEPVSETAPVIPAVESTEPLATSVETPAAVPSETATLPTNGETKTEVPTTKTDKRKSSLPWMTKKEKPTSDEESEKPKSPFAKLRATVKGKPKAEKVEKTAETKAEEPETAPEVTEPATEEPVVSEPVSVVPATTPQVTASA
ncbi:hypothetical protein LOCC1_G000458 [Lachnellula occidentalis]|uniref:Meiotic expression up-regulated protein 6 PH domain-containing protein n=1 Tax=Lachnellula occidentalis TaxID=215460 RepID=A0A8H8UKR3_9HELO|nr:hypothetical protein LOCC1_G000458 [Lachnellula occidentalis]